MTRINTGDIIWNTGVTFGVALVSGAATWAVKKIAHRYFGDENHRKVFLITTGLFMGGTMATYASRATVMTFPYDKRFREFHSLHILFTFVFDGIAAVMLYDKKTDKAMILGSVGILFVLTFLAGIDEVGSKILPVAGAMGALVASYPYRKC